ncbi:hypothetical protein KEJ50_03740 [Candidatus Bathyarchaeota archaeon]|nr:hypothetical protein [Candidatus Bathyarchaeota archaeon]
MKAYKKDEVIRACVNLIAQFVMTAGFETKVELKNQELKAYVDEVNAHVNLEYLHFLAKLASK